MSGEAKIRRRGNIRFYVGDGDGGRGRGFGGILDLGDSRHLIHFSHLENGFELARIYNEADCVVQTCCLKTHGFGGHFSLSLKLTVGMVAGRATGHPYMTEMHKSPHQRQMIAEMNAGYSPDLIVLDGVEAFTSGGPATGERVNANVIIAGTDRIAVDAVGVAVLRILGTTPEVSTGPIFAQDQIARAVELGLGVSSPRQIEVITGDDESLEFASAVEKMLTI